MNRRTLLGGGAAGMLVAFTPTHHANATGTDARAYLRTNWSRDPFAYGSYSYLPKGVAQSIRNALEAPVDQRLFFAGEATHPTRNSTVHAAYESGIRAANAVAKTNHRRVAVIGAGISGLAAAHALGSKGLEVTVFEARDRIGGRIRTARQHGLSLDLGASWIHGTRGNPLTALADRLDIKRIETGFDYILRGKDGRKISDLWFPDWLAEVTEIQQSAGADSADLNLDQYAEQEDYEGSDVLFPGGYDQVLHALDGDYSIRLNAPVERIEHSEASVTLSTATDRYRFEAAIVTLPLGVLKAETVSFDPALPTQKRDAIAQLGMGLLDKLYLYFDEPFWDRDTTWILTPETSLPRGHMNQWLNLMPSLGQPILVGFHGGSAARELASASDAQMLNWAHRTLSAAYPG